MEGECSRWVRGKEVQKEKTYRFQLPTNIQEDIRFLSLEYCLSNDYSSFFNSLAKRNLLGLKIVVMGSCDPDLVRNINDILDQLQLKCIIITNILNFIVPINLEKCQELIYLKMNSFKKLRNTDFWTKTMKSIAKLPKLYYLEIYNGYVDAYFIEELSVINRLTVLNLNFIKLDIDIVRKIPKIANLTELHVADTYIDEQSLQIISSMTQLNILNINNNGPININCVKTLSNLINLRYLHIETVSLIDDGLNLLCRRLKHLQQLYIKNNRIGYYGIIVLCLMERLYFADLQFPTTCLKFWHFYRPIY